MESGSIGGRGVRIADILRSMVAKGASDIHIEPGASFIAGGVYWPDADDLKKIRKEGRPLFMSPARYPKIIYWESLY